MKRMFLPVGQGAFYCEKFSSRVGTINIVYDCGTVSGKEFLTRAINLAFPDEGEEIDAVVISHLHEDHINGLPLLMKRCTVKNVYLPLINSEDLALLMLEYVTRIKTSDRNEAKAAYSVELYCDVVQKAFNTVDCFKMLLRAVAHEDNGESLVDDLHRTSFHEISELSFSKNSVQNEMTMVREKAMPQELFLIPSWRFLPFNIKERNADIVKKRFIAKFGNAITPERISKLISESKKSQETLKEIRNLYHGLHGEFNSNSLLLYSGSKEKSAKQKIGNESFVDGLLNVPNETSSGCLYAGDFNASNDKNWQEMKDAYESIWSDIGCVQIPHHGSRYGFNDTFLKMNAYNVISAGLGNKYSHPSNSVLMKYQSAKSPFPFIVTQHPNSLFCTVVKE